MADPGGDPHLVKTYHLVADDAVYELHFRHDCVFEGMENQDDPDAFYTALEVGDRRLKLITDATYEARGFTRDTNVYYGDLRRPMKRLEVEYFGPAAACPDRSHGAR